MGLSQTIPPYAEPISLQEAKDHLRVDISDDDTKITGLIAQARAYVESETHNQLVAATWVQTHRALLRRKVLLPVSPAFAVDSIDYLDLGGLPVVMPTTVYSLLADRYPANLVLQYLQVWPTNIRFQENDLSITFKAGYVAPFTADATANTLAVSGRVFALNDGVRLSNSGGVLPTGLAANTQYYVVNPTNAGATIQLAATIGGSAIDFTTAGTGTNFIGPANVGGGTIPPQFIGAMKLLISLWYENRDDAAEKPLTPIPRGVDEQLWNYRIVEFE